MGLLASFVRFKVDFSAGSSALTPAEESQFVEKRTVGVTAPLGYMHQMVYEAKNYSGAFTSRERYINTLHWINLTSGEVDTSWITADFTAVESAIETYISGNLGAFSTGVRFIEHRWYAFGASIATPNPPARVTTLTTPLVGTSSGVFVPQVGMTVTLRTALRRHWGRIYVPVVSSSYGTNGQMSSTQVDGIAAAWRTALLVSPATQGVVPVVWDRARKLAFGVTALEVDSVPDIQRRRRPRDPGYKKIYTS